jgi:hypothetical protein
VSLQIPRAHAGTSAARPARLTGLPAPAHPSAKALPAGTITDLAARGRQYAGRDRSAAPRVTLSPLVTDPAPADDTERAARGED